MLCRQQYDLDCEMACLGRKGLNSLEKKVRKGDYFEPKTALNGSGISNIPF